MKKLILIIFVIYSNLTQAQNVDIKNLVLVCNKVIIFKNNKAKTEIRLLNKSKDTLKYRTMSCSWQEYYLSNSENISIVGNECDKNIPAIITINPNESKTVTITLIAKKQIPNYFKLGLKIYEIKESQISVSENKLEECKIVWCSTISTRK